MALDAFIVGEGWMSEHFFTTDAKSQSFQALVANRRKEWDELDSSGVLSCRVKFSGFRAELESQLAELQAMSDDPTIRDSLYQPLKEVLGYVAGSFEQETVGPLTKLSTPGITDGAPLVLIDARPVDAIEDLLQKNEPTLLVPFTVDENDKHDIPSVARLLSALFVEDDGPSYALVFAGKWMLIAERERWPEGRYFAVDLQLVAQRNDQKRAGEIDRALTCLSAESLGPDAEGDIWWNSVLEDSIKHTVGVSKDLREGVRLSIEIIANDVVQRRQRAGLEPLPAEQAQTLAKQSLRFLYRILFLLYAEASPELKVLPVGAAEYEEGYSLDRLRELTLVPLVTETAEQGTHFYQSLAVLFGLVDTGYAGKSSLDDDSLTEGIEFNGLKADLFLPKATELIDEVKLSDSALQQVLTHLLLTKEQKGKDRGFISYADLGINQLGAVYEGLMSYTGFFAETPLYEVAKDGDASKGSWVVPTDRAQGIAAKDFVTRINPLTGEEQPVIHEAGSFVFRLAGRERQQSASYYTPEVLTRFTVSQALEELLDQEGERTSAEDILKLTVCEPALGSGAFAIEAVRQLADEYLRRRQEELGERIAPEDYPRELQKVKAYIALHNVYGVDLNATAVELAEITLWLETMSDGLDAPWFGLHLRRGNSLVGAAKSTYSRRSVENKSYLNLPPEPLAASVGSVDGSDLQQGDQLGDRIFHFLLPALGWGAHAAGKEIKDLAPDYLGQLKTWRKQITQKLNKSQIAKLVNLSKRVRELWKIADTRLAIAESQISRDVEIWGRPAEQVAAPLKRSEIEAKLSDSNGAILRLKLVMDAWCALWFWPSSPSELPPNIDSWIEALSAILGTAHEQSRTQTTHGLTTLAPSSTWDKLNDFEESDLAFAGVLPINEIIEKFPWICTVQDIASNQGFFHWDLEFSEVFSHGGFDLQIGNPPWVRPDSDSTALLAEGDPWWQLATKPTQAVLRQRRTETLQIPGIRDLLLDATGDVAALSVFLGDPMNYPKLAGLRTNLYMNFMQMVWRNAKDSGMSALIHPETHFTDEKAGPLRAETYPRLRRHWHFLNEKILFEVDHHVSFGVHVYGKKQDAPGFAMATNIYTPDVVTRSYLHDGSGPKPGLKDTEGNWDLRPHKSRLMRIDEEALTTWNRLLESPGLPVRQSRMVYAVNIAVSEVLKKLATSPRLESTNLQYSSGWNETTDRSKGIFDVKWGVVSSWQEVIIQGPNIHIGNPFYKSPNPEMLHNLDWSLIDLEALSANALPVTSYKPLLGSAEYESAYSPWALSNENPLDFFRIAWRNMAANTGERTLIPALIPPGAAHVNAVMSCGGVPHRTLVLVLASMQSMINDFLVRVTAPSTISRGVVGKLAAIPEDFRLTNQVILRTLRLNCLTDAYAPIWNELYEDSFNEDRWRGGIERDDREQLGSVPDKWSVAVPLRRAADRRQALVELDALMALVVGLEPDELCDIYRTQFAVLYGYDRQVYFYDANGRLVPNKVLSAWRSKGGQISEEELTAPNASGHEVTYALPFQAFDREEDLKKAFASFKSELTALNV